jgi:hypothetical protein
MHERTYERLRSEAWEAEMRAQERLAIFIEHEKAAVQTGTLRPAANAKNFFSG